MIMDGCPATDGSSKSKGATSDRGAVHVPERLMVQGLRPYGAHDSTHALFIKWRHASH